MSNKLNIKAEKDNKDQLKGPDEFQRIVEKAAQFFVEYGVKLAIGTGVLVVAIIVTVMVNKHMKSADIDTASTFSKAFAPVASQVLPDPQMQALPVVDKTAVDSARKAIADFVTANPDHEITGIAQLGHAIAAVQAGDSAGAADILKPLVDGNTLDAGLQPIALQVYAIAADNAGRRDEAQAAFTKMTESANTVVKAYAFQYLGDMFNPTMKATADQPVDQAKALEYYNSGVTAIGDLQADNDELSILLNSMKIRIAGLK